MARIDGSAVQAMVSHWLKTPVNGYLGSNYGQDLKSLLQTPLSTGAGDELLAKLRRDVPILQMFPGEAVNLYAVREAPDKLRIVVEVAGQSIDVMV